MKKSTFSNNTNAINRSFLCMRAMMAVAVIFILSHLLTINVHAAGTATVVPEQFNYIYYADTYPDLKAVYGYNAEALLSHYILFGQAEGRLCYEGDPGNEGRLEILLDNYKMGTQARKNLGEAELNAICLAEAGVVPGMDPLTISTLINNYLSSIASYDYSYTYRDSDTILKYGTGVCQGYALAFKRLMNAAGVQTDYVYGNAWNRRKWGLHAWNRFQVNGIWYYVDVTWNDGLGKNEYLNISESAMSRDHIIYGLNKSAYK